MTHLTFSLDIGNGSIIAAVPNLNTVAPTVKPSKSKGGALQPLAPISISIDSVWADATHRQRQSSDTSPIVELNGLLYHVGDSAQKYPVQNSFAEVGKHQPHLIKVAFYAAISDTFHIDVNTELDLVVSSPTVDADTVMMLQETLTGLHIFNRNGQTLVVKVASVTVVNEGLGAVALDSEQLPDEGYCLVIDIGAGTVCALVVDVQTLEVIDHYAAEKSGVMALASLIGADFRAKLGDEPQIADILRGLKNGGFQYAHTGLSFADEFNYHVTPWLKGLSARCLSRFSGYSRNITSILWCGGGAMLCQPQLLATEQFTISSSPVYANCIGGLRLVQPNSVEVSSL